MAGTEGHQRPDPITSEIPDDLPGVVAMAEPAIDPFANGVNPFRGPIDPFANGAIPFGRPVKERAGDDRYATERARSCRRIWKRISVGGNGLVRRAIFRASDDRPSASRPRRQIAAAPGCQPLLLT